MSRIKISESLTIPQNSTTTTVIRKLVSFLTKNAENMIFEHNIFSNVGVEMPKLLLKTNQPSFPIPIVNVSENPTTIFEEQTIGTMEIVRNFEEQVIHVVNSIQENSENVSQSSDKVVPEHLKSIFENISKSHTESQIEQIKDLLITYQDIFMVPDGKLGRTGLVKYTINTGDARPIKLPPRRLSAKQKEIVDNEIDKMLDDNIIEPSSGPCACPILLVKMKDGSICFCIDYRKSNVVVKKDAYPLPRTD